MAHLPVSPYLPCVAGKYGIEYGINIHVSRQTLALKGFLVSICQSRLSRLTGLTQDSKSP